MVPLNAPVVRINKVINLFQITRGAGMGVWEGEETKGNLEMSTVHHRV